MLLEEAIYNELKSDSTLATKLANGVSRYHIYPLRVPDDVAFDKAITYTELSQTNQYPMARTSLFQLSCIAKTFQDAVELAEDVERVLNDFSNDKLGGASGFAVAYIKTDGRNALYDDVAKLYLIPVDIRIKYKK